MLMTTTLLCALCALHRSCSILTRGLCSACCVIHVCVQPPVSCVMCLLQQNIILLIGVSLHRLSVVLLLFLLCLFSSQQRARWSCCTCGCLCQSCVTVSSHVEYKMYNNKSPKFAEIHSCEVRMFESHSKVSPAQWPPKLRVCHSAPQAALLHCHTHFPTCPSSPEAER